MKKTNLACMQHCVCWWLIFGTETSKSHFNIKMSYKCTIMVSLSQYYYSWKDSLYIEMGPWQHIGDHVWASYMFENNVY